MILKLLCPHCKNKMLYQSKEKSIERKRKVCVYCGKSFGVRDGIL